MGLKYDIKYSLDSPERTYIHKEIILNKKFLKKLYEQWYSEFTKLIDKFPAEKFIELGSGGGFLKDIAPNVICTDVMELSTNDITLSALDMPFEAETLRGVFMIDTLHHICNIEKFLDEVNRTLKSGGKLIMIEPVNSLFGRFIYKNFHHEPFYTDGDWTIPDQGPLSGANGALPWIVFERDRELFEEKYPNLRIEKIQYRDPLLYLISGGLTFKQIIPDFMFGLVNFMNINLPKIWHQISMFQLVIIGKN